MGVHTPRTSMMACAKYYALRESSTAAAVMGVFSVNACFVEYIFAGMDAKQIAVTFVLNLRLTNDHARFR